MIVIAYALDLTSTSHPMVFESLGHDLMIYNY